LQAGQQCACRTPALDRTAFSRGRQGGQTSAQTPRAAGPASHPACPAPFPPHLLDRSLALTSQPMQTRMSLHQDCPLPAILTHSLLTHTHGTKARNTRPRGMSPEGLLKGERLPVPSWAGGKRRDTSYHLTTNNIAVWCHRRRASPRAIIALPCRYTYHRSVLLLPTAFRALHAS